MKYTYRIVKQPKQLITIDYSMKRGPVETIIINEDNTAKVKSPKDLEDIDADILFIDHSCTCLPKGIVKVERVIEGGVGFILKGSGFYKNDYKDK